jgi:hypothetical protein
MNLDVILPTTIGVLLLMVGAHNEFQWRRRLWNHVSLTGRVMDLHPDDEGDCYPEIEYEFLGQRKSFRSSYSIMPTPFIGESVKIVANHFGEDAEYLTKRTRWYFTTIPIVAGLASLAIGLL